MFFKGFKRAKRMWLRRKDNMISMVLLKIKLLFFRLEHGYNVFYSVRKFSSDSSPRLAGSKRGMLIFGFFIRWFGRNASFLLFIKFRMPLRSGYLNLLLLPLLLLISFRVCWQGVRIQFQWSSFDFILSMMIVKDDMDLCREPSLDEIRRTTFFYWPW